MKEYKSVCPYDCPDACGLIVSVDNNKVISVEGIEHMLSQEVHYALRWHIMKK